MSHDPGVERIQETLRSWCGGDGGDGAVVDFVVTTGGTGFGLKDYTPEAVRPMFTREAPGIAQALLAEGLKHTPLGIPIASVTLHISVVYLMFLFCVCLC